MVPAISEHRKDVRKMEFSMIGYGFAIGAKTDLVASGSLDGLDLPRYRRAVQAARQRASRAGLPGKVAASTSDVSLNGMSEK